MLTSNTIVEKQVVEKQRNNVYRFGKRFDCRFPKLKLQLQFELTSTQDNHTNSLIIFPDDHCGPVPEIEEEPKCSDDFCEEFDYYPYEYLRCILSKDDKYKSLVYGIDEIPLGYRNGEDDGNLCRSIKMTRFLKVARNKNNEWRYIVNQGNEEYVQGILIEKCVNENSMYTFAEQLIYRLFNSKFTTLEASTSQEREEEEIENKNSSDMTLKDEMDKELENVSKSCPKKDTNFKRTLRKKIRIFEVTGKRTLNLELLFTALLSIKPTSTENERTTISAGTPEMCQNVEKFIMQDRRVTVFRIAEKIGILTGTVHSVIHDHLEISRVSARWVPRLLTPLQKGARRQCYGENLELLRKFPTNLGLS
ncbi:hypothetical protein ILUMI_00328 [Ignelater luminosus]|uniref:Uncharacterized protein n=1 Tax=Ignelater luminosus TaxID=2038154 RepID=A0A8K0DKG1_IGNLU|nr:hypothetical protein ILUMI_00328 [Ignelater luminosus]